MGILVPVPPIAPGRFVPRLVALDIASDATFEAWVNADTDQTLEEFCHERWQPPHWIPRPPAPPAPPPLR